jgi:hypothetical protein
MNRPSPLQERMWFLHRLIPSSGPAFNVSTATRLRGAVDTVALHRRVWTAGEGCVCRAIRQA